MKGIDPVKIAKDLIALKSYDGASEPLIYIKGLLKSHGAHVQEIESNGVKNIYAAIGRGDTEIGFNGHYDTVPPGAGWNTDPLKPVIKKGNLYGLGASDMKASMGAMLAAYLELAREKLPGKIIFQAVGDEEKGGENGTKVLVDKKLYAKRMVVGEPSGDNIGYGHKSIMRVEVKTHGVAAHASRPYIGENAILKMNSIINRILHDDFLKMKCKEKKVGEAITCNLGILKGGRTINVIPDECTALLDIRIPHEQEIDDVEKYLRQICGKNATIRIKRKALGMYTRPDHEFILTCQMIARGLTHTGIKLSYALGACDGRYFTYKNIPTVKMGVCGFDREGHRMFHRKNEFVAVEDIYKWKDIFKQVALYYVHRKGEGQTTLET